MAHTHFGSWNPPLIYAQAKYEIIIHHAKRKLLFLGLYWISLLILGSAGSASIQQRPWCELQTKIKQQQWFDEMGASTLLFFCLFFFFFQICKHLTYSSKSKEYLLMSLCSNLNVKSYLFFFRNSFNNEFCGEVWTRGGGTDKHDEFFSQHIS